MTLCLHHLCVGYGNGAVLRDFSLTTEPGITVLLGCNGSGKTTLFRTLIGGITPSSGTVTIDGEPLFSLSTRQRARRIAAMPQVTRFSPGITALDYAEMGFYAASGLFFTPGSREHERVRALARDYQCDALLDRTMDTLSAGEAQLISLLSVMVQDTPLILLDEPTAALDYNRTHRFLQTLTAYSARERKTVLMTLHDPQLALTYGDRIVTLRDGSQDAVLDPKRSSLPVIRQALERLYPSIRIFSQNGRYFVFDDFMNEMDIQHENT